MTHELNYELNKSLIRKATTVVIWRLYGGTLIAIAVLLPFQVYFIRIHYAIPLAWFLLGAVSSYLLSLLRSVRQSETISKSSSGRSMTIRLDEDSISFQSSHSYSAFPWRYIKKVWKFKEGYLVFFYNHPWIYSLVPVTPMNPDADAFFLRKTNEARITTIAQ
jgi:hypothetical protein